MAKKKKTEQEVQFYSLDRILEKKADYNIIFGERSNGKTYALLKYALERYIKTGEQFAYVRRYREDLRGKRGDSLFQGHVNNGVIEELTNGEFNEVFFIGSRWFLSYYDSETQKRKPHTEPFGFAFSISEQEHEKSSSYPKITTIIFDEFLTRRYYIPDEFMLLMNLLSTIIRLREDVKVFMLGNTVNKYCPYFTEMGLKHAQTMEQGTIDIYSFGKDGATVAVEFTASISHQKKSNKYFCFDNQNLQMITGGKWELAAYPHLPTKYVPKDVAYKFYIKFGEQTLQGNIIIQEDNNFLYIHSKTTEIKNPENYLIYSLAVNGKPNYKRRLLSSATPIEKKIARYFAIDKVFYQDNEIGEVVRNYIISSTKNNILGS